MNSVEMLHPKIFAELLIPEYKKAVVNSMWISVKDRLPEDGQNCILYHPDYPLKFFSGIYDPNMKTWYYADEGYNFAAEPASGNEHGITHWMPMPEPPKE